MIFAAGDFVQMGGAPGMWQALTAKDAKAKATAKHKWTQRKRRTLKWSSLKAMPLRGNITHPAKSAQGAPLEITKNGRNDRNVATHKQKRWPLGHLIERGKFGGGRDQGRCKRCRRELLTLDTNVETTVWKNFI